MKQLFNRIEELLPIATAEKSRIVPLEGIKAVIFDIYGTLLISNSGDIGSTELRGQTALQTFQECGITLRCSMAEEDCGKLIVAEYEEEIHQSHQDSHEKGIPQPEVDIIKIWKNVITELQDEKVIISSPLDLDYHKLALTFEMHNNAVYPMPHMCKVLEDLELQGIQLGIISNAQFFTPLILNHFLNQDIFGRLPYFNPKLQVFSYLLGRAKPDIFLYQLMAQKLQAIDLVPSQCLYIGNDMLNDISPAVEMGYRTALFAGDTRSLRLRRQHPRCSGISPDCIITSLDQIPQILES